MTSGYTLFRAAGVVALAACASPIPSGAQSLAARIKSAPTPRIQFEFAARPGVCGDGQSFVSGGNDSYYGSVRIINGVPDQPCSAGPIRVVVDHADDAITNIETVAGPLHIATGATDLGTVSSHDAVDYLILIASTADGRAARQAIIPATLADGVDVTTSLTTIARNQNRPLDTRRAALASLAHGATDSKAAAQRVTDLLVTTARDENETQAFRRAALDLLANVGHGDGIPALVQLATDTSTAWTTQEALRVVAQSDDPRAREFLRTQVKRTDLPEAMLAVAIRGLGGRDATGQDIALLRSIFVTTTGDRPRTTIMETIAQRGTASDRKWLLEVVRDSSQTLPVRRRALDLATRGTERSADALALYGSINEESLKGSLIEVYARNGDRASVDKLIAIAKADSDYSLRRRAIASLSRTQDPRARQALIELSTR
ncbi:MAG: HEAT repeat domain-containing protein [Gemmatimonadaceae bacterium]